MGRTNQKKLCYTVSVSVDGNILHNQDYISLGEIANDLNLTYHQVAALSIGRSKQFDSSFKYQPKIQIKKISN